MDLIKVTQVKGTQFTIEVRSHKIGADMHREDGGNDSAMNPVELLVGALCACIGMMTNIYCAKHDLPSEGIAIDAVPTLASDPKRIQNIAIDITLPEGFPEEKKEAILRTAAACHVHHALVQGTEIDIDIPE
jgi:putative redox protein